MTPDTAREILIRIGAAEESSAVEVLRSAEAAYRTGHGHCLSPMRADLHAAMTALDTLRAAREEKMRDLARRLAEHILNVTSMPQALLVDARAAGLLGEKNDDHDH